jgi:predicted small metal-binding protein
MPERLCLSCTEVGEAFATDPALQRIMSQHPMPGAPEGAVPCTFAAEGSTMEDIMEQCAKHASENHGWHSFPPEMWNEMRKHVRTVQA